MNDVEKQKRVMIILVNYNGYRDTIECIKSLNKIEYKNYQIVVVDNKSTDESIDELKKIKEVIEFELVESNINNGFSFGNNLGIKLALKKDIDYVLLLNNDTLVEPDFLNKLIDAYKSVDGDAVLSGTILYEKERSKIWYAGGEFSFNTARTRHWKYNCKYSSVNKEPVEVTFVSGCEMLIPMQIIKAVGYMDEDYFLYSEDVDYCARINNKGYKMFYVPESIIYHKVSASTSKLSKVTQYYSVRNRKLLIRKNITGIKKYTAHFFSNLQIINRLLHRRLSLKYVVVGIIDFYKGIVGPTKRVL